jgi:hypothetical protein
MQKIEKLKRQRILQTDTSIKFISFLTFYMTRQKLEEKLIAEI